MSDDLDLAEYEVPADTENGPSAICSRLVATCSEFAHLLAGEPRILILFRTIPKVKGGREVLGECCMPTVQGSLRSMFEWLMVERFGFYPDFLIILDKAFWEAADDLTKEILCFHELMHADQAVDQYGAPRFNKETGLPCWKIRGHSVEEFFETVRRYGAYSLDLEEFKTLLSGHETSR